MLGGGGVAILCGVIRGGLAEKATCKQRLGGDEGVNHLDTRVKSLQHRESMASAKALWLGVYCRLNYVPPKDMLSPDTKYL